MNDATSVPARNASMMASGVTLSAPISSTTALRFMTAVKAFPANWLSGTSSPYVSSPRR